MHYFNIIKLRISPYKINSSHKIMFLTIRNRFISLDRIYNVHKVINKSCFLIIHKKNKAHNCCKIIV